MRLRLKCLASLTPSEVYVEFGGWHRGYRPILWKYEFNRSLNDVAESFGREMPFVPFEPGVKVDPRTLRTPNVSLVRDVDGIHQGVAITRGVHHGTSGGFIDQDSKSTVWVIENVDDDGPLPRSWPDQVCPPPATNVPLPWSGLKGNFRSVTWEHTPALNGYEYYFNYLVHAPYDDVLKHVREPLESVGYKTYVYAQRAGIANGSGGSPYIWVEVKRGTSLRPNATDWTTVTLTMSRNERPGQPPGPWVSR